MFSKKYLFLLIAVVAVQCSYAQLQAPTVTPDPEYKSYKWDENPKIHTLSPDEQKMGMVVVKDKRIVEYYFEDGNVVMYVTRHMIIRVNSDKAIEESNTVYIPMA